MDELNTRTGLARPLLPSEGDENWAAIKAAIDALEAAIATALNPDGTLKDGAVATTTKLADGIITLAKLEALGASLRPAVIVVDEDGLFTVVKGTEGQLLRFGVDGVVEAVNAASAIVATAKEWLYSGALTNILNRTSAQASWTEIDLNAYLVALGAEAADTVILRAEVYMEAASGDATPNRVLLRVTDDNAVSTSSGDTPRCICQTRGQGFDDQGVSCAQNCEITMKLDGTSIWYNADFTSAPAGSYAKLWLVGFRKLS